MDEQLIQRITEIIEPVISGQGYELVHLELLGGRRNAVLRITIDRPGGITIDECAHLSHQISVVLDVEDPIPHRYTLEVCSPGLERGLYKKGDYERFAGQPAKIQTFEALDGRRTFNGELLGISGDMVTIHEDNLGKDVQIPYQQIRKANLVFLWGKQK
jgi:ribosome maturation factor RimP